MSIDRRRNRLRRVGLALATTAAAALAAPGLAAPVAPADLAGSPRAVVRLEAIPDSVSILPGRRTAVFRYTATVESGDPSVLEPIPDSYLGPIFRLNQGDRLRVRFLNRLGEPTIVHWHGLVVPDSMDGHPRFAVGDGGEFVYDFTVLNRAGTYWYHPHPDMTTGPQVVRGLAGLFLTSDSEEAALGLPRDEFDLPIVVQDRAFDASNQFDYWTGGMHGSFLGDRILVNGRLDALFSVATRAYRLRLLNGCNARICKLAWSDGTPMTVLGTDGGLLEAPVTRPYVTLAPGERAEVWCDLSQRPLGSEIQLQSLEFDPGGMDLGGVLPQGAAFDVARLRVDRSEVETLTLPAELTAVSHHQIEDASNGSDPRAFAISFAGGEWFLNGRTFQLDAVAPDEIVHLGDLEAWRFTNVAGMPMMQLPHPMHLHGVQFQIHQREVNASGAPAYATLSEGFVDGGWKDTVLLPPGSTVTLLVRFTPFPGLYLYHCHNLEHEDMGMMRNFRVEGDATGAGSGSPGRVRASLRVPGLVREDGPVEIRGSVPAPFAPFEILVTQVTGRAVRSLRGMSDAQGSCAVTWNLLSDGGLPVPSGVYFLRLLAAGGEAAGRTVLLRK